MGRTEFMMDALRPTLEKNRSALIFSNTYTSCDFVARHLKGQNVKVTTVHSKIDLDQRQERLDRFTRGEFQVLSCTDLISRGVDTLNVSHVVNFEFPLNMFDYVHRVGRVGRVSSPQGAKVTSLVRGPVEVKLVQDLELAVRTNKEISNVNNNVIRILQKRREKKLEQSSAVDDENVL